MHDHPSLHRGRSTAGAAAVVLAFAACDSGHPAPAPAARAPHAARAALPTPVDTLWQAVLPDGAAPEPQAVATDERHVVVVDAARHGLVALRQSDGSVAWQRTWHVPTLDDGRDEIAVDGSAGTVQLLSRRTGRLATLTAGGAVTGVRTVPAAIHGANVCAVAGRPVLAGAPLPGYVQLGDAADPVGSAAVERRRLPWPDLPALSALLSSATTVQAGARCVVALNWGRGFAVVDGDRVHGPYAYVHAPAFPRVRQERREDGVGTVVTTDAILDRRPALLAAGADSTRLIVAAPGDAGHGAWLDAYAVPTGRYVGSHPLAHRPVAVARRADVTYVVERVGGQAVVLALRDRPPR